MNIIRTLWRDPRFRVMVYAIVTAVAAYVTGLISGAPVPTP